ncbi:MAG: tRNA pseudouridine(38-40) synthase TruA [Proteobacteria bacterium]|nr:tRNA pseudouridine(38-40) synthase TruA [Pseudomonadota bacterium]
MAEKIINLRRYRLTLEYDGTNFSGWQKQTDARTVQGDLLKAAVRVFGEIPMDIQGCGRTDAGVHALEYVAHLEVASLLPPQEVARMLEETLPKDMAVRAVEAAEPRFHARHSCIARSYVYHLRNRKSAFGKRYSWWVHDEMDLAVMQRAGAALKGMHDFAAFAEKQELKKSTKVMVHQVRILADGELIRLRVVGSHFLWHMVRRMVGVLVEVGCNRLSEKEVAALLHTHSDIPFNHTAPAAGLFFEKAFYDENELERFLQE